MSKFHTNIDQWGLVSGIRQAHSDLIIVAEPRSPFASEARKGQLMLLVEAEGDVARGRQACAVVARTIHDTFYADGSPSITSSLRSALKRANAELYRHNFEAPPHKRAFVGVSCAVIHGNDLFITQAPPAQAFVSHTAKLRAIPEPPAWTKGANVSAVDRQGALGTSLGSEPEFFRSVIQVGDAVVLCSSNIVRLIGKEQAETLICYSDAVSIADELYAACRAANLPEAHVLVIEAVPMLEQSTAKGSHAAPSAVHAPKERATPMVSRLGELLRRRPPTQVTRPLDPPIVAPVETSAPAPVAAAPAASAPHAPTSLADLLPVADDIPLPPSAFLGEGEYGGTVRPPAVPRRRRQVDLTDNHGTPVDFAAIPRKPVPPPPSVGERITLPFRALLASIGGGVANVPRRTARPAERGPAPGLRLKGLSYRRQRPPIPWFNILLIVGIVVLLVVVGIQQNRRRDNSTVTQALAKVDAAVAAARSAPTSDVAQQRLDDAEAALSEVDQLVASGMITTTKTALYEQFLGVRNNYDRAMASINRIGFVDDFETVATLPGGQALDVRIALGTTAPVSGTTTADPPLYYLDRSAGALYEAGNSTPLIKTDDEVNGARVAQVRDLVWRPENNIVLAFDRGDETSPIYRVYLRNGDGWLVNQLNGTELMLPPTGSLPVAIYSGNLYFWDKKANNLWRYPNGLYADLPTAPWITDGKNVPLENVQDVQVDGNVYLLNNDGSVLVFTTGVLSAQLPKPDLATPISSVSRFVVTSDEYEADGTTIKRAGYVYVLDTKNERVLQIDKRSGDLIQQIQARNLGPLNKMSDIAVDEQRRMLYIANGADVLRTELPEPPENNDQPASATETPEP